MKTNHLVTLGFLLALTCTATKVAHASTCEELTKECLTYTDAERESCLRRAVSDPLCDKTTLGAVIVKRTQLSPTSSRDPLEGPAFLGPQIVDKKCISNFDTELSAGLIRGAISAEKLDALSASLDRCARSYAPDITRP